MCKKHSDCVGIVTISKTYDYCKNCGDSVQNCGSYIKIIITKYKNHNSTCLKIVAIM